MARRLKVLLSAYACEPNKGSEPEVGWQWGLQMARFHDVTVLTRENNRAAIERAVSAMPPETPRPEFVYYDRGPILLELKRRANAIKLYYLLWQRGAHELIQRLHAARHFDLLHHVTFAAFRYPAAVWGHGVATIWGPVGGIESFPRELLPWHHPASLLHELARNFSNLLQSAPYHVLPRRAEASTLVLASTQEMRDRLARLGLPSELMPTIGLHAAEFPPRPREKHEGPPRLLFVGNVITLKGIDLAIEAFAASRMGGTFTIVGAGNYLPAARAQARRLGVGDRVHFTGRLPRREVLRLYPNYDLFLFPSVHDTGGYAVIEAMINGLPVICLDYGGPAMAVAEGCGVKVPLGSRSAVVERLADAIRAYDKNREWLRTHGQSAREQVLEYYDWDKKGEQMAACYTEALERHAHRGQRSRRQSYSGMGGLTNLLHRFLSFRGAVASLAALLLAGLVGFVSIGRLRTEAAEIVYDTLPGLSYAGEANSSLAAAFNRTLLIMLNQDPARRDALNEEVKKFSAATSGHLRAYEKQIYSAEDRRQYALLLKRRTDYFRLRQETIEMEAADPAGASALLQQKLAPAYYQYKLMGDKLFEFNLRQGKLRGDTILTVSVVTEFIVAAVGILIFIVGFFIGVAR